MVTKENAASVAKSPRFELIDGMRGLAIIGVVIYHLVWDLRFYQFTSYDPVFDPIWLGFAKVLLSSFLVLAGVSLVLAHGQETHWRAFWKRFGILAGAALVVSVGTYLAFSDGFVYFGILHALALFSLIGVFFVRVNIWLVLALAILFLGAAFVFQSAAFNPKYLTWIGFWTVEPYTQDLVPMFPGLGFVLAGIVLMRGVLAWGEGMEVLAWRSDGWWFKALTEAGRWSLIIYLVHQPILFGIIVPLSNWLEPGKISVEEQAQIFHGNCVAFYTEPEGKEGEAETYCSCATEMMVENDLLDVTSVADLSAQQSLIYEAIPRMCQAMAE